MAVVSNCFANNLLLITELPFLWIDGTTVYSSINTRVTQHAYILGRSTGWRR